MSIPLLIGVMMEIIRVSDILIKNGKKKKLEKSDLDQVRKETKNIIDELNSYGIETDLPQTRGECPSYRPCPFISCRHHLYLDIRPSGAIVFNFPEMEPSEMKDSCSLDVAEANHGGLPFSDVGSKLNLTRERVRQIQEGALCRIRSESSKIDS